MGRKFHYIWLPLLLTILSATEAFSYDFSVIERVSETVGSSLNYDYNQMFDFNGDGTNDIVQCRTSVFLKITDGKSKAVLYEWIGPEKTRITSSGATHTRTLTGCEITRIDGKLVVLLSNYWTTPNWRTNAPQYAVFKSGTRFVRRAISVKDFGPYYGVVRSIRCGRYPQQLVNLGYKSGSLCFFADYTAATDSHSALLKFEFNADQSDLVVKDLSGSSGLHWRNGVRGTSIWSFPVGRGFASNQRDGAFMMDSAFLDFSGDGLTDFMTVGQHAKIRAHKMAIDSTRSEGVRFTTAELTQADRFIDMTELLKVTAVNRLEPLLRTSCFYLSGERQSLNDRDHIRCFEAGAWRTYLMPIDFNSEYSNARIRQLNGNLIIKTRQLYNDGTFRDLTFRVSGN